MKRLVYLLVATIAAVLLSISIASAQTSSGDISGRVVDPSSAAIPNAEVILTNQLTSQQLTAKTDKSGNFVFASVQPGTFSVSVRSPGFKQFDKKDLRLSASERLSAGILKLDVGSATQTVTVTAEQTQVQTQSAERSALLDDKEISGLMSQGRDVLALVRLLPGVVKDGEGANNLGTESAGTVSGVRESSNAVSIDGTLGNPRGDGNKLDTPINMDAVGEVKVLLNDYQAEYGQSAGAVVNISTKSGTQQFHGSAYYYGRNEAFNANSWFNNNHTTNGVWDPIPRQRERFNTIGYNLGGPVYIPGHFNTQKDKLFFFFSQERWPTQSPGTVQKFMMPTAAERAGDFSKSFDKNGNPVFVADPLLIAQGKKCSSKDQSGCFPGNIIPTNRIDPNMQKMMNILPLPNTPCIPGACDTNSGALYNFLVAPVRDEPSNQTVVRVDYNLSAKWRIFVRGTDTSVENRGLTSTANKTPWGIPAFYQTPNQNFSVNLTYAATSTLVNEFQVGWAGWKELQGFANPADASKLEKDKLGITVGQNNPTQNPLNLVPRITGLGSSSGGTTFAIGNAPSIDFDNRFPMKNMTGTWEGTDGLTKVWGNHTAKAGVYFQSSRYLQRHIGSTFDGAFDFRTNSSNPKDAQYAYADWLLGDYNSYSEGSNVVDYAPHWKILEWYLQDNWKLRPNLTVDYGMRFTYDLPTQLAPGFGAGFVQNRYDPTQVTPLYQPVLFKNLTAAQQLLCRGGAAAATTPSRCAQNPQNPADVKPDVAIGAYAGQFSYTGSVINTDPSYPHSLRFSNGVLFGPRLGLSWDPFGDGKTAVRLGGGLFYNTREGGGTVGDYSLIAPLVSNPSVNYGTASTFTPNCGTSANGCTGAGLLNTPQQTRVLEPNRAIESTVSANFGIQRKIGFDTVVDVSYVGTFGRHLNQQVDLNEVPYLSQFAHPDTTSSSKSFFVTGSSQAITQPTPLSDNFFRPIPGYASVNLRDYGATSNYNSLQTSVNRRFTKGLQFGVSYTFSKAMTTQDTVDGAVAVYQDRRFWNYSEASFDRTHDLVFHWLADLPKASRLWDNRVLKAVADNWEWSGIAELVSGAPQSIDYSKIDVGGLNITGGGDGYRLLLAGNPLMPSDQVHSTKQFADKTVFLLPPVGVIPSASTPGITRNNVFRGPGTNNFDMALQKNIPITEHVKFTLRGEAYNVFNHVSFSGVDMVPHFDTSTKTGTGLPTASSTFGQVNKERGERTLQLSGRITF